MMRKGFTSGSCAAAAASAAAWMLLLGIEKKKTEILTPAGIPFPAEITDITREEGSVSCGVVKDGGDDPDITTGLVIMATVAYPRKEESYRGELLREETAGSSDSVSEKEPAVILRGGEGVGIVTAPGLDQPVGSPAINRVPREMIIREVKRVMELADEPGPLIVTISVPGGREAAEKTFNPRLGIRGGISILGTTGIVEPMSEAALRETIRLELRQRRVQGQRIAVITPGNYGMNMLRAAYGYDLEKAVRCSNFIGDTLEMAVAEGYERLVLLGHMGKLVKCAGGAMNTHSRYGDGRMELIAAEVYRQETDICLVRRILSSVSTEAALQELDAQAERGLRDTVCRNLFMRALTNLRERIKDKLRIEMIMYTNAQGIVAESSKAVSWLRESEGEDT